MCLAHPARVVAVDSAEDFATVEVGGIQQSVSVALVDGVKVGDYLLIHVGYALNCISEEEAKKTLALFAEAGIGVDGELTEPEEADRG